MCVHNRFKYLTTHKSADENDFLVFWCLLLTVPWVGLSSDFFSCDCDLLLVILTRVLLSLPKEKREQFSV